MASAPLLARSPKWLTDIDATGHGQPLCEAAFSASSRSRRSTRLELRNTEGTALAAERQLAAPPEPSRSRITASAPAPSSRQPRRSNSSATFRRAAWGVGPSPESSNCLERGRLLVIALAPIPHTLTKSRRFVTCARLRLVLATSKPSSSYVLRGWIRSLHLTLALDRTGSIVELSGCIIPASLLQPLEEPAQ